MFFILLTFPYKSLFHGLNADLSCGKRSAIKSDIVNREDSQFPILSPILPLPNPNIISLTQSLQLLYSLVKSRWRSFSTVSFSRSVFAYFASHP